jgi:hypothetical protein
MASASTTAERRRNLEHRQIFDSMYDRVEPFLDPRSSWSGQPLEHLAFSVLREHYPQLGNEEINGFFSAAKRVFNERDQDH